MRTVFHNKIKSNPDDFIHPSPDYLKIFMKRQKIYFELKDNPVLIKGAKEYYRTRPAEFINDWGVTYDPRNAFSEDLPTLMPFILFDIQVTFIDFLKDLLIKKENGLVEKTRDMGATWVACAFTAWAWLFLPGSSIGWGSRKEILVDRKGDPDSIFEKIRMFINSLPIFFRPEGYNPNIHSSHLKLINPENSATITGEAGDNIGRGGRSLMYFKDESAHYERPHLIEASLGDNTEIQVDFSSVNGTGNVFHNRRQAGEIWSKDKIIDRGVTRVCIMDWRDHPYKTQEWYDARKAKYEREGLSHIFAQEVDRDYNASVEGVLIPSKYVNAAIDAHIKLNFKPSGIKVGGLDVADEGLDKNAFCFRHGPIMPFIEDWSQGDTGETANKAVSFCKQFGINDLDYDCIGVGAGIKSETNRMKRAKLLPKALKVIPWSAAGKVLNPEENIIPDDEDTPLNKDFYQNIRIQAGWQLRLRFEKTYKMVNEIADYPFDELISIPSHLPQLHALKNELSQPTYSHNPQTGKLTINKKPEGTKSPNLFDCANIAYWPILSTEDMPIGSPGGVGNTGRIDPDA